MAEGKSISIAAAQPRISYESFSKKYPKFLKEKKEIKNDVYYETIENEELVSIAFKNLHMSFEKSNDSLQENNTHSGISWREINKDLYMVTHNMPALRLIQFTEKDLSILNEKNNFTLHDRGWPSFFMHDSRMKIISSSDIFFSIELTFDNTNLPNLKDNLLYNDEILSDKNALHNYVANVTPITWRAKSQ